MRWYLVLVVVALSTSWARSAPLPQDGGGSNPKNKDASSPTTTAPSAAATVDDVAAALSSKLAQISLAIGRLPILSLPSALVPLKTRKVKVVVPFQVIINVKALEPAHSRRSLKERAVNPKRPRPTTTTRTTRLFESSTVPLKIPVTSSTPPDNPKHVFMPSPVIKVVSYTYTAAGGGATTVVEAQGSRTHPGRPKPTVTSRA